MQHNPQACSTCEGCCVQENYAHNVLLWQRQIEVLVHGYIGMLPTCSNKAVLSLTWLLLSKALPYLCPSLQLIQLADGAWKLLLEAWASLLCEGGAGGGRALLWMMDVREGGRGCSREVATHQTWRAAMVHTLSVPFSPAR